MIQLKTAKVLAAVVLGLVLGAYLYHDETGWMGRGREAFLVAQNHRFDRAMERRHALPGIVFTGVLATAISIGLYELLSAGIGRVFPGETGSGPKE